MKNPRACPRIWKTKNGKYLFWFHNHSGKDFLGRNPAWISGGIEVDGHIHWSQPEILLYDPQCGDAVGKDGVRMSYPDLIEQDGRYWVSETQKSVARIHEIDAALFDTVWAQHTKKNITRQGLALDVGPNDARGHVAMPRLPDLRKLGGFSIGLWIEGAKAGEGLFDARDADGKGVALVCIESGAVELRMSDGPTDARWASDADVLTADGLHHIVATVDGGPKLITFVVDGALCDGGEQRQFGWGRFPAELGDVNGAATVKRATAVKRARVYGRYLLTSEAVANFRAGL
ncbi:MAG TPA: hypothetical protein ENN80_07460 [Candidatus Hydrogenedentes bacterium]|nr:hypothetical protein [Candidatus Hydrogenedentota bacterium]